MCFEDHLDNFCSVKLRIFTPEEEQKLDAGSSDISKQRVFGGMNLKNLYNLEVWISTTWFKYLLITTTETGQINPSVCFRLMGRGWFCNQGKHRRHMYPSKRIQNIRNVYCQTNSLRLGTVSVKPLHNDSVSTVHPRGHKHPLWQSGYTQHQTNEEYNGWIWP